MVLLTVEGVYEDGKVEVTEIPADAPARARVLVTFLPPQELRGAASDLLAQQGTRKQASERLLSRLRQGIEFGGPPYPNREELYDRVNRFDKGDG